MPLLRKCLPEMILPSKSHAKENAVLSSCWRCSAPGDGQEKQTDLPVVRRWRSDLQKTGASLRRSCLAVTCKGVDGARGVAHQRTQG